MGIYGSQSSLRNGEREYLSSAAVGGRGALESGVMLASLAVRDFVLIEDAALEFASGFTALTGETGAGKSILVDALALLRGARAGGDLIRPGASRAEIEARFVIADNPSALSALANAGLDGDGGEVIVRRVLADEARKSRIFINGRAATGAQLAELIAPLADICGQNQNYSLLRAAAQRRFVDDFAAAAEVSAAVRKRFSEWQNANAALADLQKRAADADAERERLDEELAEFAALDFSPQKFADADAKVRRLRAAADLGEGCGDALALLDDDRDGAAARLFAARRRLAELAKIDPALAALVKTLDDAQTALADARRELARYAESLGGDSPSDLAALESFLTEAHRLARKHRLADPAALGEVAAAKVAARRALDEADLKAAENAVAAAEAAYRQSAAELGKRRARAAKSLSEKTTALLRDLAMADAAFGVRLNPLAEPAAFGLEAVVFMVATRADAPPGLLSQTASGGELSRIGLALQIAARGGDDAAIVFDEIDAGVGGATAAKVGALLKALGARRQVLCVTHLPQVAACADCQWRVISARDGKTRSAKVQPLSAAARIEEIARMLAAKTITAATRAHAAEMLAAANPAQK